MSANRLSFREKAGYSAGEIGGSGLWQIMMIFLPAFYTDTFGLSAESVGWLLLISRIIDAGTDPVMGILADRTNTRWGRFRPYLIWASVPFALLAFAVFFAPQFSPAGKTAYAWVTYLLMMVVYTMAMIPYSALSGVMTSDGLQRTQLNSFRFVGAFLAALTVQGLFKPSVAYFGDGDDVIGSRWTMFLFGLVAAACFLIAFVSSRERIGSSQKDDQSIWQDLRDLSRNLPWLIVLLVSLITLIHVSIRSAAQVYYFKYYIGDENLVSGFMVAGTAAIIAGIGVTGWLARMMGKRELFVVSTVINAVAGFGFYLAGPDDVAMLFALQVVYSFAAGPAMPLLWSMMADAADYSEWKTGRRATGLVFAASTLAQKAGGAFGGATALFVLAWYGYEANTEQSAATLTGMRQMISIYPGVGALLCALLLWYYPLSSKDLDKIEAEIGERRRNDQPEA